MSHEVNTQEEETAVTEAEAPVLREVRLRPVADVYRGKDAVRLLLDMPGATEQDVEVEVEDGVLNISARVERGGEEVRIYERAFRIDRRMDISAVEAHLQRGVLQVRIPYREEVRPRRIEVKTA